MRVAGLVHPPGDRLGDDVARREVGELVLALHEPVALEVDEEGALAADRLADQRLLAAGVGAEVHHRRVELHELQVAQHRAGAQRQRHAVAGRDRRVGGLREDLAEPARGEYDGPAAHRPDAVALALAHHVQGDPGDPAVLREQQVDGQGVLDDLDVGRGVDRRDQRALDLRAGGVAAGVRDPVAVVAALAGQREHARPGEWSKLAPSAISSRTASGPSLTRTRTAAGSQAPAPATRVSRSCWSGVSPGPSAAAIPPWAHWVEPGREHVLGDDEDLLDLVAQPQRGGQAGDAGADHDDVGVGGPAGRAGGEAAGSTPGVRSSAAGYRLARGRTGRSCAGRRAPGRCRAAPRPGREPVPTIRLSASTKTTLGW